MKNIEKEYKKIAPNFMTPEILKYEIDGDRIVELSKGTGIGGGVIYGVTELVYEDSRLSTTKRGQMCRSKQVANRLYKYLLNK